MPPRRILESFLYFVHAFLTEVDFSWFSFQKRFYVNISYGISLLNRTIRWLCEINFNTWPTFRKTNQYLCCCQVVWKIRTLGIKIFLFNISINLFRSWHTFIKNKLKFILLPNYLTYASIVYTLQYTFHWWLH